MPALIENHKRKVATTRIKKFYTSMLQAIELSELTNGSIRNWNRDNIAYDYFMEYFVPHLNIIKIKKSNWPVFYFPDGSTLTVTKGNCIDMIYDVNGDKNPNTYGVDRFDFVTNCLQDTFIGNKKFGPISSTSNKSRDSIKQKCIDTPQYCGALLEIDNWEFKPDYPHKI